MFEEDAMENADETHFVFNMDNGRTLGFRGTSTVKYADVVSGGENITMMVRITGGSRARIEVPFLIFRNAGRSHPIRGVPDIVPGVCYRSSPKGWMDGVNFAEWLREKRATGSRNCGAQTLRHLFVDNCSGHVENEQVQELLAELNIKLHFFPPNATDVLQPADSFVIQKLKDAWRRHWDAYKANCVQKKLWTSGSGMLPNPGKSFFLKLAAKVVREVNQQRDKTGVTYARRAMIRTGMSLNLNGLWEEGQLSDELQAIVAKYRSHFEGEKVITCGADVETETESESRD